MLLPSQESLIATLMGKTDEIDCTVNYITKKTNSFGILHGQHIMATDNSVGVPPNYAQLDCINLFKSVYDVPVDISITLQQLCLLWHYQKEQI